MVGFGFAASLMVGFGFAAGLMDGFQFCSELVGFGFAASLMDGFQFYGFVVMGLPAWVCGYGFAGIGLWWLWAEVGGIRWPWVSGFGDEGFPALGMGCAMDLGCW
uniref:Uncharacterized protein n=1 Tax=Fagus sylvatica TaxID=28930 RepID=A0A2N9J701_FAGSY